MTLRILRRLAAGLLAAAVPACQPPAPPVAQLPPPVVTVAPAAELLLTEDVDFTGKIEPVESVDVRARVSGYLDQVAFKPGTEVKKDQLLFVIDQRPYKASLDQAKGQLEQVLARVKRLEADFSRAQKMSATGAMSKEEFDRVTGDLGEARAGVSATRATVERAELDLKFTEVRSPIAGRISKDYVTAGNLVTADSTLLSNIVTVDPVYVTFDIDEQIVLRIQQLIRDGKFQSARVEGNQVPISVGLQIDKGFPHKAVVSFIDNRFNPNTGTLLIRATLPNPVTKLNDRAFTPGEFVRIRLALGEPAKRVVVPERAVGTDQDTKFVFVVTADGVAERRDIKPGLLKDGQRVVLDGVKAGERVIVNGTQRVRPKMKVDAKAQG